MTLHAGKLFLAAKFSFCSLLILFNGGKTGADSQTDDGEVDGEAEQYVTDNEEKTNSDNQQGAGSPPQPTNPPPGPPQPPPSSAAPPKCPAEFICKTAGWFANPVDCRHYFKCILRKSTLLKYPFDCGVGRHFEGGKCLVGPGPCPTDCNAG